MSRCPSAVRGGIALLRGTGRPTRTDRPRASPSCKSLLQPISSGAVLTSRQERKPPMVNASGATQAKVRFVQDGALGTVTLDSPPLNQIGQELLADLVAAIDQVEAADGIRALVLRGEGSVFSAGADVALFAGMGAVEMRPMIASFLDLGRRLEQLPFPTLAAVHGTCMAGGFELALFCDLIWAAEGTMMGLPETRLGIVPLAGGVERMAAGAADWRRAVPRAGARGVGSDRPRRRRR
ncbi:MAG: enoyl-CoA hydratase/isomerase family protein [Actinobacteria bacterium]|nr:MAG: enoyl-CoA hydratase/isomerase family protein [Actinomycetota bacterium]